MVGLGWLSRRHLRRRSTPGRGLRDPRPAAHPLRCSHDPGSDRRRPGLVRVGLRKVLGVEPGTEVLGEAADGVQAVAAAASARRHLDGHPEMPTLDRDRGNPPHRRLASDRPGADADNIRPRSTPTRAGWSDPALGTTTDTDNAWSSAGFGPEATSTSRFSACRTASSARAGVGEEHQPEATDRRIEGLGR